MTRILKADELRHLLKTRKGDASVRCYAEQLGVSASYLCEVMSGQKEPDVKISAALGFEPVTFFVRVQKKKKERRWR